MARKPAPTLPTRAIALVRISDDPDGRAIGVGRQEDDCRALAERLGWGIAEVIVENDTSAYSTKQTLDVDGLPVRVTKRPEFRRALKALHAGRADGLIVYDIDRLARQPRDLEALIDLAEVHRTPVVAVTGSLDVSSSAGIAMARVLMAMANKSSADTGRRVARAARQRAEAGIPKTDGFRPYGYDRTMRVVPEEAEVVREIAQRILLGDPVRRIAIDLNARGIPTARGGQWRNPAVKSVVRKATVAGLRAYTPTDTDETELHEGTWPPILDRTTWELVCSVLDRQGGERKRAVDKYLLSGLARCGACGSALYVGAARGGSKVYRCNECHKVTRSLDFVDAQVVEAVHVLLAQESVRRARTEQKRGRPGRTLVALAAMRERRREILRDFAVDLGADDLREMLRAVDARIAELEAEASAAGDGIVIPEAADFDGLPLGRKRAVLRALLEVTVLPSSGRALDPSTIRITPAY